MRDEGDAL